MHTFQINVLIQILASSTRFEHNVFTISMTICTFKIFYGIFFILYFHVLKKIIAGQNPCFYPYFIELNILNLDIFYSH
jgi:hypothetical protein